jgi:hypothetical protein
MSEEKVTNETTEQITNDVIEVIKEDAIVSIKMSTGYYKRIQEVTKSLIENKSAGVMEIAHQSIREQKITEPWVFHYETLLILCNEFEKAAKEGNHIHQMTMAEFEEHIKQNLNTEGLKEEDDVVSSTDDEITAVDPA